MQPADRPPMSRRRARAHRRRLAAISIVGVLGALTSGCITGERPTLVSIPAVADPAVSTVLARLERADAGGAFDATYEITPTTEGVGTVEATVHQSGRDDRDITIGNIEYRVEGRLTETCIDGVCEAGLDDAPISNLNLTHRFWGGAFAARLRNDDARKLAPATGRIETIANRSAACADLPVVGGQIVYCALDEGVLARYRGADVAIELTSFSRPAESGADS